MSKDPLKLTDPHADVMIDESAKSHGKTVKESHYIYFRWAHRNGYSPSYIAKWVLTQEWVLAWDTMLLHYSHM